MSTAIRLASIAMASLASCATCLGQHGEIGVGRTAGNRLVPHMHFDQPVVIPRSVFPGITGFATGAIGFESVPADEPDEGLFALDPGSDVGVRLVGVEPEGEVRIYNGLVLLAVGESLRFGPPFFDFHVLMSIPSPQAVHGDEFTLSFVLHDASGVHSDSEEFTLSLTPACPADFDLSGSVSVQDIFAVLGAFFAGFSSADFNLDGLVGPQDIYDFLGAFFLTCP